MMTNKPTVFLDRDGVINRERNDHVKTILEFEFIEGTREAITKLTESERQVIIVTNQSIVGRGLVTDSEVQKIHSWMMSKVEEAGGKITAVYFCPHTPEDGCQCRKPKTGLFEQAATEFDIDLRNSWVIGNQISDLKAGRKIGAREITIVPSNEDGLLLGIINKGIRDRKNTIPIDLNTTSSAHNP